MLILSITDLLVSAGIWLVTPIFKLAAFAFKIFMILAQSDVLTSVNYTNLINNFYLILGVVMLFIMAFSLLMGLINPDDQKQGTAAVKKLIINFVISCIILGFLPTIFTFLFDAQNSILRYNVIGGFFDIGVAGEEVTVSDDNIESVERSANEIVNGIYTAFFNVNEQYLTENCKNMDLEECQATVKAEDGKKNTFDTYIDDVNRNAHFLVYDDFAKNIVDDEIDFNFLIELIAGAALVYIGVSYCFDMALRLIKLVFYQLIAPIPVFLRIVPNSKLSGTFTQWLKITLTCWGEVFIRIFIFYFSVWLCTALMDTNFMTQTVYHYGWWTGLFTKAFILMAIIMFMKRSPKLLSEITGIDSGNMKLGIKDKFSEVTSAIAGVPLLGAGIAATGTLGKKAISAVDAKRNGRDLKDGWRRIEGKGPYAKFKKWKNELLPYTAANIEDNKKSSEQMHEIAKRRTTSDNARSDLIRKLNGALERDDRDLLGKVLTIKDENGNEISIKEAKEEQIKTAIMGVGSGELIKYMAAASEYGSKYKDLGKTYEERSTAKKNMFRAQAEYEAAVKTGDSAKIQEAQAVMNKYKDSYEALDNEWKQRLTILASKSEIKGYKAMKYMEDRGEGLKTEPISSDSSDDELGKHYTATRGKHEAQPPVYPSSGGEPRGRHEMRDLDDEPHGRHEAETPIPPVRSDEPLGKHEMPSDDKK